MRSPSRRFLLAGAAVVVLVAVVLFATKGREGPRSASDPKRSVAAPVDVGSQTCASCHAREYAGWRGSDHERAMLEPSEQTVLGDFNQARFTHQGVTSRFFRRGGKYVVNTEGPDGQPHDYEIRYTFGVRPLQQYLIEFPGGRLQAFGIAWDSREKARGGQRWFALYPDRKLRRGDPLYWTGIDQVWNYQCAECHSTNLRKGYDPAARTYRTRFDEIDVACEACHGPGSAHVAWAKAPAAGTGGAGGSLGLTVRFLDRRAPGWTLDASTRTMHRTGASATHAEVEACAFCHARRGALREGHVPGRPIGDTHRVVLLEEGVYHADGQILGEDYEYGSFLQSRMYRAGVTCSDCHDPHTGRRRLEGNALCDQCHLATAFDTPAHHHHPAGSAGARCVSCHMPERTYMVVDARRDHSFRVPRPDLSAALGTPNACTDCHSEHDARWAEGTFFRWYGRKDRPHYAETLHMARSGLPGAGDALARLASDPGQPSIVRATAVAYLSDYLTPALLPVVARAVRDADPLVRGAAVSAAAPLSPGDRLELLEPLLTDSVLAVRIDAGRALCAVPARAMGDSVRMARDRALAEYRGAQMVNADRPESWLSLGNLDLEVANAERAEREYRTALDLDPTWEPAYANLADLMRARGRDDEGEKVLREGIRRLPEAASLYHALGLLEVRRGQPAAAIPLLQHAAELAPQVARYGYAWSLALMEAGRSDEALRATEAALRHCPNDSELLELRDRLKASRSGGRSPLP